MSAAIEDCGIIGDCETVAFVGRDSTLDFPQAFSHIGLVNSTVKLSHA